MQVQKFNYKKLFKILLIQESLFIFFLIIAFLLSCNKAPHKNNTLIKTKIQSSEKTFQELGFFGKIKENEWDLFLKAVQNNISNSRKEKGNLSFSLYQPVNGDYHPIWFERFVDKEAHHYHKEQNYFKNAIKVIQNSLEEEPKSIELKELKEIPATIPIQKSKTYKNEHLIILLDVIPEKRQHFIRAINEIILKYRKDKSLLEFNIYQYTDNPYKFVLIKGIHNTDTDNTIMTEDYIRKLILPMENFFASNPLNTYWQIKDISR